MGVTVVVEEDTLAHWHEEFRLPVNLRLAAEYTVYVE